MTFISYVQNFEDVMLWRALKHIKNGFYVDVGAAWPDEDSVTKAFYENGWQGINIELHPQHYASLVRQRPLDINLEFAVADHVGRLNMTFVAGTGLSTAIDEFAEQHKSYGWKTNRQEVPLTTLKTILSENIKKDQPIHFMKVDVEGLEDAVLRGNDWATYRPWIVVVEATLPMSQTESFDRWEPVLLKAEYTFTYADGLNRFYVAIEHLELLDAFKYPPNVFDGFLLGSQQKSEVKAQQAEDKAEQAEAKAEQTESTFNRSLAQLSAVYESTSWRVTSPLRWIGGSIRRLRPSSIKLKISVLLQHAVLYVGGRPQLKRTALVVLNRFPAFKLRIMCIVREGVKKSSFQDQTNEPVELTNLSPRASKIYVDLNSAIKKDKGRY